MEPSHEIRDAKAEGGEGSGGGRSSTVQSVEVAVRILEAIAENNGAVRVTELARVLGMTKARVSRHLQTLLGLGLVERAAVEGYTFGWKLLQLGRAAVRDRTVTEIAKPHLQALRDEVGQSVILSVPTRDGSIVVLCVESQQPASVSVRAGTFLEFPKSPAARLSVALASGARAAIQAEAGSKRSAAPVRESLARLRESGADYETDTQGTGLGGVAVPVFDDSDKLVGIISLVMPSRFLSPKPPAAMLRALRNCGEAVEAEYRPTQPRA